MVGHVVLVIHIVYSLETNRAGPGAGQISRQIIVLSEHNIFTLKGKIAWNLYCTVTAWIMPTLCPFLMVLCWAGLQTVIVLALLYHF